MTRTPLSCLFALVFTLACETGSCPSGGDDCVIPSPCARLQATCEAGRVAIRRVSEGGRPVSGPDAVGTRDDLVLENDRIGVVIDALGEPHMLAPTGGTIIDLAPLGGADMVNQLYQLAGILPADAFHYTEVKLVDESPRLVAVELRGTLDGRKDVKVATRYELRPCEPGIRIRSELHNGSPEVQAFMLADASFWGNREPLPFAVATDQGFTSPELDLIDLDSSWSRFPAVFARPSAGPGSSYAFLRCDKAQLEGLNDPQVSALGTGRTLVRPGESLAYERYIATADGIDVESAARVVEEARAMLHGTQSARMSGRITAASAPFGGTEARATVVVAERSAKGKRIPVTEVIPGEDGVFGATVPSGKPLHVEVRSFGRTVKEIEIPLGASLDLGDVELPAPPARLTLTAVGPSSALPAVVVIAPADRATLVSTEGTQHGHFDPCAPWLGPPHGGSPACNRLLVTGSASVELPAGHYHVYASAGPFYTLDRKEVTLVAGQVGDLSLRLSPLPVLPPGVLSADLHVHGRMSFDSSLPDRDRILSLLATGVDVLAATDHDVVHDYEEAIRELNVGTRLAVMAGVETTGLILFLDVPSDPFPRVIGHFNFWPVMFQPDAPRGGAPWDELMEPGELFDRMDQVLAPGGLAMLNHPWETPQSGRDLGYLRAIGYDPRVPVPLQDDGSRAGMLARRPGGGHGNLDFQIIEVLNGRSITKYIQYRSLWWSLLSQGHVYAGTANSDSHSLNDSQIGYPRNLVHTDTRVAGYDPVVFNRDVRAGRIVGSYGVWIDAKLDGKPFGLSPFTPTEGAMLDVEVRAAPWIPVAEVRFVVNGKTARTIGAGELAMPGDPLGKDGLVRYKGSMPLAELLAAARVHGDAWLLVEAGLPLPLVADLDDDGIVDTSDNNHDGVVDKRDVEPGEDKGPLNDPPDPPPWEKDSRVHLTIVAPGTWPTAFTNPWLLDLDGDGTWEAPGL
ncbi:MAG: PHP domain-containing protein [Deltaproteobacteria bacterium]|nr:PHP domain-containing protein [Deltaproteobacteria bacterium]